MKGKVLAYLEAYLELADGVRGPRVFLFSAMTLGKEGMAVIQSKEAISDLGTLADQDLLM